MNLSHKTRASDASTFDQVCIYCGATDRHEDPRLAEPCPKSPHLFFEKLHEANIARDKEWNAGGVITLHFRAGELFGEGGETANIMKKLERERLGMVGTRSTKNDLEEELADVVICTNLIAMHVNVNLETESAFTREEELAEPFGDYMKAATALGQRIGAICGFVEHNEITIQTSRIFIAHLVRLLVAVGRINREFGLNVPGRVTKKFNATSLKYGLTIFMREHHEQRAAS